MNFSTQFTNQSLPNDEIFSGHSGTSCVYIYVYIYVYAYIYTGNMYDQRSVITM